MGKEIIITLTCIIGLPILYFIIKELRRIKPTPDPWDNQNIEIDKDDLGVCSNCLTPIKNKQQHYCPNCGATIGEYTRNIPFVNIQHNYSMHRKIINKLKNRQKRR